MKKPRSAFRQHIEPFFAIVLARVAGDFSTWIEKGDRDRGEIDLTLRKRFIPLAQRPTEFHEANLVQI
jgi:hypothetical protein